MFMYSREQTDSKSCDHSPDDHYAEAGRKCLYRAAKGEHYGTDEQRSAAAHAVAHLACCNGRDCMINDKHTEFRDGKIKSDC